MMMDGGTETRPQTRTSGRKGGRVMNWLSGGSSSSSTIRSSGHGFFARQVLSIGNGRGLEGLRRRVARKCNGWTSGRVRVSWPWPRSSLLLLLALRSARDTGLRRRSLLVCIRHGLESRQPYRLGRRLRYDARPLGDDLGWLDRRSGCSPDGRFGGQLDDRRGRPGLVDVTGYVVAVRGGAERLLGGAVDVDRVVLGRGDLGLEVIELAAAAEVEAVDAGTEMRAVRLGAGEGEHARTSFARPPGYARQVPNVPSCTWKVQMKALVLHSS